MTWPSVLSSPTSRLPTPTPTRLPRPPMITTARLNTSISASADGYSDKNAPPINPPSPPHSQRAAHDNHRDPVTAPQTKKRQKHHTPPPPPRPIIGGTAPQNPPPPKN